MTRQPTHCYVSRKPCGCIVLLTAYHYDWRADVARSVAQDIKAGLIVNCIPWAEYTALGMELSTGGCAQCTKPTQKPLFEAHE